MTLKASPYDQLATQRILEFCDASTTWTRRLWQAGSILIARELVEAGDVAMGASDFALKSLQDELLARVNLDPGLCAPQHRNSTRKLLASPVSALVRPGHTWNLLNEWVGATRDAYLPNWAASLRANNTVPDAESAARLLTAHLLDEGFSRTYIHRWLTYRIKHTSATYSLADMCDELHISLSQGPRLVEVLVPLAAHVQLPRSVPSGWLTPSQVRGWREENIPNSSPVRQYGGVLLTIAALDIYSGADAARDRLVAIRDRFRVGGRHDIVPAKEMWIAGVPHSSPTEPLPRRVEVHAFERQEALWSHSVRSDIEAAMELMAPLERGPSPAAVTGAWAAIESLLVGPGDSSKSCASERFALVLAAGHLRAELTALAWSHAASASDDLADTVKSLGTNQERAESVLEHLQTGGLLALARTADATALKRILPALDDTHAYVEGVRRRIEPAIRGLYRQRNLLSHAGGTAGVAIKPTLERVAPLVAAGMDRLVHAALTSGHSALELAARAQVRHEALRTSAPSAALRLLGD